MQFLFDREVLELDFTTFKYWDYALSLSLSLSLSRALVRVTILK